MKLRDYLTAYEVGEDGCWNWTGPKLPTGYGHSGRIGYAHRYLYTKIVGPIPAGLELDHLCRNRGCVNPAHLEPVTHQENVRRAKAVITACPQGHAYTPDNLVRDTGRKCKTCLRERTRARRALAVAS